MIPKDILSEATEAGYVGVQEVSVDGETAYLFEPPDGSLVGMPVLYAYEGDVPVMLPYEKSFSYLSDRLE